MNERYRIRMVGGVAVLLGLTLLGLTTLTMAAVTWRLHGLADQARRAAARLAGRCFFY